MILSEEDLSELMLLPEEVVWMNGKLAQEHQIASDGYNRFYQLDEIGQLKLNTVEDGKVIKEEFYEVTRADIKGYYNLWEYETELEKLIQKKRFRDLNNA